MAYRAWYACVLVNVDEARESLDKAIVLGGDEVKLRALEDENFTRLWCGL